jgi:nicotinamide mononucleotide transporter PnuC
MNIYDWISNNYIEVFGAVTGILYVILEIRQNIWLWPVGIVTSAVYIWVFFTGKLYADMGLQGYYLVISVLGWYWWIKGAGLRAQGSGQKSPLESLSRDSGRGTGGVPSTDNKKSLTVTRIGFTL